MEPARIVFSVAGVLVSLFIAVARPAAGAEPGQGIADFPKLSETDWPWWRGPGRDGVSPAGGSLPVRWSETENISWKATVPGRGHSSPIVVGDRVVLTTADE